MRKKNTVIELLIKEAEKYKRHFKVNLCAAASICGISYKSFLRYKKRMHDGKTIIEKRGRKPLPPINYDQARAAIHALKHGRKRTAGTGALLAQYQCSIPRWKFNELVTEVRNDVNKNRREEMTHIQWLSPNIAWSMDGYEYLFKRIKSFANQVQDMTSKYKFDPQAGTEIACGEEIAGELRYLFTRNNPPLFFKLDNGSNLNHIAVFDAMEDFGVIPLNSPAYYPQYNGSMEHAQGEIKRELDKMADEFDHPDFFMFAAKQAVHSLNHKPRPSLQGAWSCTVSGNCIHMYVTVNNSGSTRIAKYASLHLTLKRRCNILTENW